MDDLRESDQPSAEEYIELNALLHGLVQKVGFRAAAQHCARELKLSGSVRNLDEGGVEIIARGRRAQVELLLPFLQQISAGHIDSATTRYTPCQKVDGEFQIL